MSWSEAAGRVGFVLPRERVRMAASVSPSALVRELVAAGEVDHLLDETRREARRLSQAAEADRQRLREEARHTGFQEGRAAGHAEGYRDGRAAAEHEAAEEVEVMLSLLDTELTRLREEAIGDLARLAINVASRLYGKQIDADPDHVGRVVRDLLAETSPHAAQLVEVNPLDLPHVLQSRSQWGGAQPGLSDIRIVPSADLARGACRVLTDGGWLERDWPARLGDLAEYWAASAKADAAPRGRTEAP